MLPARSSRCPSFVLFLGLLATSPLRAQLGNELVFVGSSENTSADPFALVAAQTGAIAAQGTALATDRVNDAEWAGASTLVFAVRSITAQVSRGQWNGSTLAWSTFYAPGLTGPSAGCFGIGIDRGRRRLWTLVGAATNARELVCLDVDPASATYGLVLGTSTGLAGFGRERWGLSPSGELAAVPTSVLANAGLQLVDTNPASATFLQVVGSTTVPVSGSVMVAIDALVSASNDHAYVLCTGLGQDALAVYHVPTQTWLDFGGGPLLLPLANSSRMVLSLDASFALVTGGSTGNTLLRIDFDYNTPVNTTVTSLATGLSNCSNVSLSPEGTRVALTTRTATAANLHILDVANGMALRVVPLPSFTLPTTTAWQEQATAAQFSTFGTGCAGSLGMPTLQAAPGSLPVLGAALQVNLTGLPFGLAVLDLGLSNTVTSGGAPLPIALTFVGMVGCHLWIDPLVTSTVTGSGTTATWVWNVPNAVHLVSANLYLQSFPLDPSANSLGFTASNAGVAQLGF